MFFTVVICTLGLLAGTITVLLLWFVYYLHHQHCKYDHIPSPPRDSFFLGHIPRVRKALEKGDCMNSIFHKWTLEYGHTICVFAFHKALVITVDPTAVKEFLVTGSHYKHEDGYGILAKLYGKYRFFGNGLVTELNHEVWAKRRMIYNPAFHRGLLKQLMIEFNQTADDLMKKLQGLADGKTQVSLLEEMNNVSMDIIGKVAFGKNIDSIHDNKSPFRHALHVLMDGFMDDQNNPLHRILPLNLKLKNEVNDAVKLLRDTGRKWLEERMQAISRGEYVVEDILSYVIQAYDITDPESLEKCLDDIVTFLLAGQETTATTMAFLLQELGKNPEIFNRLQEEVDQVVGQKAMIEYDHLGKLEYLGLLMKETLRMYPPVGGSFRGCSYDTTIQGFHIPKGTGVGINFYGSGRTPEFHPDPETFKPERFHKDSAEKPNLYSYCPFSVGPRSCIGQNFAQIELKIIISKFMQHFELKLDPTQSFDIVQELTLKPKGGTRATLTLRTK